MAHKYQSKISCFYISIMILQASQKNTLHLFCYFFLSYFALSFLFPYPPLCCFGFIPGTLMQMSFLVPLMSSFQPEISSLCMAPISPTPLSPQVLPLLAQTWHSFDRPFVLSQLQAKPLIYGDNLSATHMLLSSPLSSLFTSSFPSHLFPLWIMCQVFGA